MQIPLGDQKAIFIAQKVCHFVGKVEISLYSKYHFRAMLIGFGDTQMVNTILGKNQVLKVNLQCQLHTKVKNAVKSFGAIRIKINFVEKYKECTICAILRDNTLFCLGTTKPKTCCAMLRNVAQRPKNDANPSWGSEKDFYCLETLLCLTLFCLTLLCLTLLCLTLFCLTLFCLTLLCLTLFCLTLFCLTLFCLAATEA